MEEDLVFVSPSIHVEDLELAYENLIFPWPMEGKDLIPWFSPQIRGVLNFDKFHLSKSTKKTFRKTNFRATFCKDFEKTILCCAHSKRKGQEGTWINDHVLNAYVDLFKRGKAYSVEVWSEKDMVGGLYGVVSEQYVSGESMFYTQTGASKFAIYSLVERLSSLGVSYLDTQMVTPLLKDLGGEEISKREFHQKVKESIVLDREFYQRLSE